VTLLDEDTAVALGYGLNLFQDDLVVFFDFGFSGVRARLVQFHWRGREAYAPPVVRASAVLPAGLADIILRVARQIHPGRAQTWFPAFPWEPYALHGETQRDMTQEEFRASVEREDLAALVRKAMDRLWEEAEARSIGKEAVKRVCLIGSGTRLPQVREALEKNFGGLLRSEIPQTAAGRGGLLFLAERPVDDMVRGDYAMRVRDPVSGEFHYPVVVERYTRFPTKGPVSRFIVNTFYDGQYEVHLEIYRSERTEEDLASREIIYGDDGKMSFVSARSEAARERVGTPVVLPIHPPGRIGERRLLLEFRVDGQKKLLLTARDLREDKTLWEDKPIADLR
jgi:molecular chaperone DnaK (HSP70)